MHDRPLHTSSMCLFKDISGTFDKVDRRLITNAVSLANITRSPVE